MIEIVAKVYCKARVLEGPDDVQVIVRKVVLDGDGRVAGIYGLSGATGKWLRQAEGEPYPAECRLKVLLFYATGEGDDGDL